MSPREATFNESVSSLSAHGLSQRYSAVRGFTEDLCEPLFPEDCVIQSMPDASPTRWHLAHTTWFFETFVLAKAIASYKPFHPAFGFLFNSYYNAVGEQYSRPERGLLSRPRVEEIFDYRKHVDSKMQELLDDPASSLPADLLAVVEIGIHHEQQHQELILTDIKHVLWCNPLYPVYHESERESNGQTRPIEWIEYDERLHWIGHDERGFAYDNESPRHRTFTDPFQLAARLVTNEEYRDFIEEGGYQRPEYWLSAGWDLVGKRGWKAPLYWIESEGERKHFSLSGIQPLDPSAPVCHVSYFEANAYARWAGVRLPTEAEWELAAGEVPIEGNFAESGRLQPVTLPSSTSDGAPSQLFGDVWEWTTSPYTPYPGYSAVEGALGEYNGKFMCNQYVLRGGSCATPGSHVRRTYRNFFPPDARWQFSGIRLARTAESA